MKHALEALEARRVLAGAQFNQQEAIDSLDANGATALVVNDLDGDGNEDVVVGSYRDGRVSWFRREANGTYAHQLIRASGGEVRAIAVADLDGDGDKDVAVAAYGDDQVEWFENRGQRQFSTARVLSGFFSGVRTLDAGDVDRDGDQDLVAGSWLGDEVVLIENLGGGQFDVPAIVSSVADGPRSVRLADVNGDGRLDLFVASRFDDTLSWFPNLGGTNFGDQRKLNTPDMNGPESIHISDLDGDGDLDLSVALYWDSKIVWFRNDGQGTFGPQQDVSTTANRGQYVGSADLDGDGDLDLIGASYFELDNRLVWFPNSDGKGSFGTEQIISTDVAGIEGFAIGDPDKNGVPDVISVSAIDNKVLLHRNAGQGRFNVTSQVTSDASGAASSYLADLDGDKDLDLVVASYWDNEVAWYENVDGKGQFGNQRVITQAAKRAQHATTADLDGDGDQDVLVASSGDGTVAWFPNTDGRGTFGAERILSDRLGGPVFVTSGDLDGDGDQDVVSASSDDSIVAWYKNLDGKGSFGPLQILTRRAIGVEWVRPVDLDGDGDLDLVTASFEDDNVGWFENTNGQGTFGTRSTLATGDGPTAVEPADIDGDGDLDLVYSLYEAGELWWLERQAGPLSFRAPQAIDLNVRRIEAMAIADIDQDGVRDVVVGGDTYVAWYRWRANGPFEGTALPGRVDQAYGVDAGDVDGNGTIDIVSASFLDSLVALYRNENISGDFDGDGSIDQADLNLLCTAVRLQNNEVRFDLTGDNLTNADDVQYMVTNVLRTTLGDANLDGRFDSRDLVLVFQAGQYEDALVANSGWAQGDWTCDGEFSSRDLVAAFQQGGYIAEAKPVASVAARDFVFGMWGGTLTNHAQQKRRLA